MTCDFEGCDRHGIKRGWCEAHYQQWRRGIELKPLREYRLLHTDAVGRVCTTCDKYKTWNNFYTKAYGAGKFASCKDCITAHDRAKRVTSG